MKSRNCKSDLRGWFTVRMRSRHPANKTYHLAENDPAAWLTVWRKRAALSLAIWTRDRICLGYREQDWMLTLEEKIALATSVLGLKRLAFAQNGDDAHIRSVLYNAFPKLTEVSYELLCPNHNSKKLIAFKWIYYILFKGFGTADIVRLRHSFIYGQVLSHMYLEC